MSLLGAAIAGGVIAIVVRGGAPAATSPPPPPVTTVSVVRTNLRTTVLTGGTLGYGSSVPIVNQLDGTYTELPALGTAVAFGQVLYRVDDRPVLLLHGATPAWRPFFPGMAAGPDVVELQANLLAFGDASGLYSTPSGHFDSATVDAVERWQTARGLPVTGTLPIGQVVFAPTPIIVGAATAAPGESASAGESPFTATTTARVVTVPLNPNLPTVTPGEQVSIVLQDRSTTPGRVVGVGPAPPSSSSPANGDTSSQSQAASSIAVVAPVDPSATGSESGVPVQVSLTIQSVHDVLAAPISALLALAGGGYGVEVVEPSGLHRLVGVATGTFTGSLVQISATGIEVGTKVVVAQ
jgi:peptidoglycan hydrolase-like protein with peptidoglycan-binding domain